MACVLEQAVQANRVNQITPYGNLNYIQSIDANGNPINTNVGNLAGSNVNVPQIDPLGPLVPNAEAINQSVNSAFPVNTGTDPFSIASNKAIQDAAQASDHCGRPTSPERLRRIFLIENAPSLALRAFSVRATAMCAR